MTKRTRKPAVKAEVRRDWLRRSEEDGESPPQIAVKDGFDVRTVRSQLALAKEERESREARAQVLRNALEKHYDDFRKFAEKLNAEVQEMPVVSTISDEDLIEAALREHIPRSSIWGNLSKRRELLRTIDEQGAKLQAAIEKAVQADERLAGMTAAGLEGVVPGVIAILDFESKQWLAGNVQHSLKDNLVIEPAGDGLVNPRFGFSHMGVMSKGLSDVNMPIVRQVIGAVEAVVKDQEEYHAAEKSLAAKASLNSKVREELDVIRLRRIVPGHCRFCPL